MSPDVEYEYVLISSTEDDKPPREINVSEENKFNVLNGAEQDNEIAQTNDQTPVSYKNAGEDENYNNGLKYNIDFDEPPEAKQRPKPFEITMKTTEPQFLLRVADVGRKLKTTPPTTVAADDYLYNIPPVFLEDEKPASNSNKENKIKKINKDTQIVITFGDEPTDKAAPVTPDVPTPSQIPIANLFSNIDYMAGPAVTDRSFIKLKNNNQGKNQKTTIARNRSKMSDADYMAYVASAIEDGLDKMTQHIKKRDFEKLYSDMISSPTKAARKERSKFLEKKPLFPNSFDKKFAYKNSSSYLDSKPPYIQKNEFRTSTPKADSALSFTNVRELKPPQGGHVYGEAQYAYHTASNINGQKSEDAGGHKIINNDGKVKEFDFTPKPISGPLKKLPLAVLDKDIGALKSLFLQ